MLVSNFNYHSDSLSVWCSIAHSPRMDSFSEITFRVSVSKRILPPTITIVVSRNQNNQWMCETFLFRYFLRKFPCNHVMVNVSSCLINVFHKSHGDFLERISKFWRSRTIQNSHLDHVKHVSNIFGIIRQPKIIFWDYNFENYCQTTFWSSTKTKSLDAFDDMPIVFPHLLQFCL